MRKLTLIWTWAVCLAVAAPALIQTTAQASTHQQRRPRIVKEWTFLVFLNGHNNLDNFGAEDINEMEKVGSNSQVNVVVQWASLAHQNVTKRLYVRRDNDPNQVTSRVAQELPRVDMGDWRQLVAFVEWAKERYPARHYFIDVWNHGSGWHKNITLEDKGISYDDISGNFITTKQLGQAMAEISRSIGHKVDVYGSDACLMSMAEVAREMSDNVETFVGSEEVEPGQGWPYDTFLRHLVDLPTMTGRELGIALTEEYVRSYQEGGTQRPSEVTFSALDLTQMSQLIYSIRDLGQELRSAGAATHNQVKSALEATQTFTYRDYGDLVDFVTRLESGHINGIRSEVLNSVKAAVNNIVVAVRSTPRYERAKGVSIWLPTTSNTYNHYLPLYRDLVISAETHWNEVFASILQN